MRASKLVFAVSLLGLALSVPVSSAAASQFHVEGETPFFNVEGEQTKPENHVITIDGIAGKCEKVTFSAPMGFTSTVLVATPAFTKCTFGGLAATIVANTCKFRFLEPVTGKMSISCTGAPLTIEAGTCEVTIGNQVEKVTTTYANEATVPKTVTFTHAVTAIRYNRVRDGLFCPLNGTGEKEDGKYEGKTLVGAKEGAVQKGFYVS